MRENTDIMDIQSFYNIGSILNVTIILLGVIAGLWVLRKSVIRATNEIHKNAIEMQQHAMEAMREEINSLKGKFEDARNEINSARLEIKRLNNILNTIFIVVKNRGFTIEIDGDIIHIRDNQGHTSVTRIKETE